jgi:hypothetical protein
MEKNLIFSEKKAGKKIFLQKNRSIFIRMFSAQKF